MITTPAGPARVVSGAVRGFVDHLVAWGPSLAVVGWAAGFTGVLGPVLGVQPLVLLPGLVGAWLVRLRR